MHEQILDMFTSDLKSAVRNIMRNRVPSVISILGLGIGLGCIIILLALIIHEKSFDRFIPGYKNVYRITMGNIGLTPYPLAETMSREFPEVKGFLRYYRAMEVHRRTSQNEIQSERGFAFADSSIYTILGLRLVAGVPATSSSEVAISKSASLKQFGNISPLGMVLNIEFGNGFTPLTVCGVFNDFPSNSTINPSFIADIRLSERMFSQYERSLGDFGNQSETPLDWLRGEFLSYIVLAENSDPVAVAKKMEKYKEFLVMENKNELSYKLQPVSEIYLGSSGITGNQFLRQGNARELLYYEVISVIILIISLSNYILLTRAGFAERIMNLGTRKAFGASSGKIKRLIILESNLIVLLSLLPATFIIEYGIELVNKTLNKNLSPDIFLDPFLVILVLIVVVFTGTLTGWLIGLFYSRIPALDLITGKLSNTGPKGRWNYSFLVLHFTIFIVFASLIIGVSKQIRYSKTNFKGINPENVIVSAFTSENLMKSYNTIKNEMERVPGAISVAGGTLIPPFGNFLPITLAAVEGDKVRFDGFIMGEGMPELLGLELVDGSSFGPYKEGIPEVLINESAAKKHNVRAGEKLIAFRVKGIIKDFNAHSLHYEIQPMVILQQNPEKMSLIAVKTNGVNDPAVIQRLKDLYKQIDPDEIFESEYITDWIESFYSRETDQARIIGAFAILAAILSIMGLFGISMISIARRRKEIGLRKVNGAATRQVLLMVNADFLKWVLVAFVLSVPVSFFLLDKWLERFAYRTDLNWWIFAVAGITAIVIAVLTVSWKSISAAGRNPVESIRYE